MSLRTTVWAAPILLANFTIACGGATMATNVRVSEAERTRESLYGSDTHKLAPQAFADADQALRAARDAERSGDGLAAELHAERAVAAYQRTIALARLARATDEETQAKEALALALEKSQRYAAARKAAEREADDLDKQLKVAREAEAPSVPGPTTPERERARLVAARSLATQARLLCSAASLVSARIPSLVEAEALVADVEKKLDGTPKPAPIDQAGRARAACLNALTKARREKASAVDQADALLDELSRARLAEVGPDPKSQADVTPTRDERGVVVILRTLFKSDKLSTDGETLLRDLGRVAAAHPSFALQVVVHDAASPSTTQLAQNKKRAELVTKALVDGGASSAKTKVELAGAHAPLFDPSDAKRRAENARVEIVFVDGG